jgi:hypothetical protein
MKGAMVAAALCTALAPLPVLAQPHDDWQPLVRMCAAYAKANPPPHANGPVSLEWIAGCVARNYFPEANAFTIGTCVAMAMHMSVSYGAQRHPNIQSAIDCIASYGGKEQHGWK